MVERTELDLLKCYKTLKNPVLERYKADGKKIVGYYCVNMPEELLTAADIYPYRIRGTENRDFMKADAILSRFNCTFVRSTLNLILNNQYQFLDGLLLGNTCDHIRRIYDILNLKAEELDLEKLPLFFISLPHEFTIQAWNWVKEEILLVKNAIEERYGVNITDEMLRKAIKIHKKNCELMEKLAEFRSYPNPILTGTDYFKISVSNNSLPKEVSNEALERFIKSRKGEADAFTIKPRARLMLVGSSSDNPEFIKILEHQGAMITSDSLCSGKRAYISDLFADVDGITINGPIDELVSKVLLRTYCPRMMNGYKSRFNYLKEEIEQNNIDGVILQRIEFCDLHGVENGMLQHDLMDKLNIPSLNIDREYFLGDTGRLRTRVEAFLEKINRNI
mgnify:CR=1 FL=1